MTDDILHKIKANLDLKVALSAGLTIGFCVCYVVLQRYPLFPVTEMKVTWLDSMIPFIPDAVYLYESLWLLLPIAPWLMESRDDLVRYSRSLAFISLAGFSIFFFYPTASPRPKDLHDINVVYGTLIRFENELNAFPSLHVALALLSGACCQGIFSIGKWHRLLRWIVRVWAAGVIVSTLLTKQHVFIDLVGGGILGLVGYALCYRTAPGAAKIPGNSAMVLGETPDRQEESMLP